MTTVPARPFETMAPPQPAFGRQLSGVPSAFRSGPFGMPLISWTLTLTDALVLAFWGTKTVSVRLENA